MLASDIQLLRVYVDGLILLILLVWIWWGIHRMAKASLAAECSCGLSILFSTYLGIASNWKQMIVSCMCNTVERYIIRITRDRVPLCLRWFNRSVWRESKKEIFIRYGHQRIQRRDLWNGRKTKKDNNNDEPIIVRMKEWGEIYIQGIIIYFLVVFLALQLVWKAYVMYTTQQQSELRLERVTHLNNELLVFNESRVMASHTCVVSTVLRLIVERKSSKSCTYSTWVYFIEWTRQPYTAHLMRQIINFSYIS